MEQEQLLIQAPQVQDVNLRLRALFKKAFEIRQMQLMVMRDIDEKYKTLEPKQENTIEYPDEDLRGLPTITA